MGMFKRPTLQNSMLHAALSVKKISQKRHTD